MKRLHYFFPLMALSLYSCSELATNRSYLTEMEEESGQYFSPQDDFPVVAGDTGRTWMTEKERRSRTPASEEDLEQDRNRRSLNNELRHLENRQTQAAFEFYETYKVHLTTTSEKIYFLNLPYDERKDYLASRGFLKEEPTSRYPASESYSALKSTEISLGMSKNGVISSWGKPTRVEVAGNPSYENERWAYLVNGATKYIYFESGEVQGWE